MLVGDASSRPAGNDRGRGKARIPTTALRRQLEEDLRAAADRPTRMEDPPESLSAAAHDHICKEVQPR